MHDVDGLASVSASCAAGDGSACGDRSVRNKPAGEAPRARTHPDSHRERQCVVREEAARIDAGAVTVQPPASSARPHVEDVEVLDELQPIEQIRKRASNAVDDRPHVVICQHQGRNV